MPKIKLTDAAALRFKAAPGTRIDYFDATLPGFALRVSGPTPRNPTGHKTWVIFYRFGGKQKRHTLDPAYPALGLAAARRKAGDVFQKLGLGEDPSVEQQRAAAAKAARAPDTIENVIDEFMLRHMETKKRAPRYVVETRRNFDNHVLPRWRGRDLKAITRREVIELLDAIVDEGKPVAANRTLAAVRKLFNWSIQRGIIEASPVAMVERPGAETRRERALDADEIRAVWEATGTLGYPFGAFFRMALATGQRRQEVAGMRWADIDESEHTWTLPSDMTKAGRAHVVPMSPLATEILAGCPRIGTYVFTTRRDRPISGYSKAKGALGKVLMAVSEAGEQLDEWTIHDLRRTVATGMGKLGVSRFTLARILNHADSSVTGIYDRHEYLGEKRRALETWGQYLGNLVKPPGGGNVVPIAARAAS
jgi:integrase